MEKIKGCALIKEKYLFHEKKEDSISEPEVKKPRYEEQSTKSSESTDKHPKKRGQNKNRYYLNKVQSKLQKLCPTLVDVKVSF